MPDRAFAQTSTQTPRQDKCSQTVIGLSFQCHQISRKVVDIRIRITAQHVQVRLEPIVDFNARTILRSLEGMIGAVRLTQGDIEIVEIDGRARKRFARGERYGHRDRGYGMRGYAFRPRVAGLKEFALQRDRLIFGADSSQVSSNRMARSTAARTVEVSRTRFRITRNDVENLVVVPIDGIFYRVAKEVGDIHDLLRREGKSRHSFFGTALENDRADRLAILVIQNHNRTKQIRSFFPTFCGGPVAEAASTHEGFLTSFD